MISHKTGRAIFRGIMKSIISMLAFSGLLLTACSKDKTGGPGPQPTVAGSPSAGASDPCKLVTKAEAEAVLGAPAKEVKPQGLSKAASCQYIADNAESVTIQVHYGGGGDYESYVKSAEESFSAKAEPVADVATKASFVAGQLIVLNKNDLFIITIGKRMKDAEKISAAKGLSQKAAERLSKG